MIKLPKCLKQSLTSSTQNLSHTTDNHDARLVNLLSLFTALILFFVALLEFINKNDNCYYNFFFLFLFIIPIILNCLQKYNASKQWLLLMFLASIYTGTFIMHFSDVFRFTIILPVSIYFILFKDYRNWKFFTIIILTATFIIANFILFLKSLNEPSVNNIVDAIIFMLTIVVLTFLFVFFIRKINLTEKQLLHRLKYESAITDFSHIILRNIDNSLNEGLKIILEVSGVSRVYIFKTSVDDQYICQTNEVCAKGVKPEINNPLLMKLPLSEFGFSRWLSHFKDKKIITGFVKNFPEVEKVALEPQGVLSILAIPIYTYNQWSGFIGFDDVVKERVWDEADINLLSAIADIIGLQMENEQFEKQIIEQNKELETLNSTKDKFFSIVAHDLKSPFNSLLGFSDLLEEKVKKLIMMI